MFNLSKKSIPNKLILNRFYQSDNETLGILTLNSNFLCYTLELPWRQNRRSISSIPVGKYTMLRHSSPKHGFSFWLQDVPNRSEILIHSGNFTSDTRGCILVGTMIDKNRLYSSQHAMRILKNKLQTSETTLIIKG